MRRFACLVLLSAGASVPMASAHPCEAEHFASCPEHGPDTLGTCLGALPEKSAQCEQWLALHEACAGELKEHCQRGEL